MIDRERAIKGLECCLIYGDGSNKCAGCPYLPEVDCIRQNKRDALALLKEREPVQVVWKSAFPYCPKCGQMLPEGDRVKYCFHCGQEVKWK